MMEMIEERLGKRGPAWTKGAVLPGGDFPVSGFDKLVSELVGKFPFIPTELLTRLARDYGTDCSVMLDGVSSIKDLGKDFGHGLHEREVAYLMDKEWAVEAQDILFRRTRLGIAMSARQIAALDKFMQTRSKLSG